MEFVCKNPAEAHQLCQWLGNKLINDEKVSVREFCDRGGFTHSSSDHLRGWTPESNLYASVRVRHVGRIFKHPEAVIYLPDPVCFWVSDQEDTDKKAYSKDDDTMVSHPPHYQSETGLEVIDVIEAFTFDLGGIEATDTGNIIKYMCRWKHKNGLQDLKKAKWYLDHLIKHVELLEKENS